MACQLPTSTSLRESLLSLPQELFDKIYDLTFTSYTPFTSILDLNNIIQLRRDYKLTHINTSSRYSFARSYYTARFKISTVLDDLGVERLLDWLKIVPEEYRECIHKVVLVFDEIEPEHFECLKAATLDGLRILTAKQRVGKLFGGRFAEKMFTRVSL